MAIWYTRSAARENSAGRLPVSGTASGCASAHEGRSDGARGRGLARAGSGHLDSCGDGWRFGTAWLFGRRSRRAQGRPDLCTKRGSGAGGNIQRLHRQQRTPPVETLPTEMTVTKSAPSPSSEDRPSLHRCERSSPVKKRKWEICTSGSVRGGDGNIPTYSATTGALNGVGMDEHQ
jgi:hypothetical protein